MSFTRRRFLQTSTAVAAGAAGSQLLGIRRPLAADTMSFEPEPNAELRLLRWSKFVQGDETMWKKNTAKFTEMTGIPVTIENEAWENVRTKAAVAANVGSGPDIILGWFDDPQQYPDKLVRLTDLAEYLGNKYGGWYDTAQRYGTYEGEWVGLPLGAAGARMVYRKNWVQEAGYEEFPTDYQDVLDISKKLKAKGHPMGMALGHGVGDANGWLHTMLWGFGGMMVNENNEVVLSSPETVGALEYVKELYESFIPGTLSWLDPNNNKVFLAGDLGATNNGISVYYAAANSDDPKMQEMAKDIYHAELPVGPVGHPTELSLFTQAMVFGYSKFPNAAKEYLRFMWEREQYEPWQLAASGYISHPLAAYAENSVWTEIPKALPYRDCVKNMLWNGYSGDLGYASATAMADYIVVDMFAQAASGERTPKEAAEYAARRAERYYKT